jgi:hypothetical protein
MVRHCSLSSNTTTATTSTRHLSSHELLFTPKHQLVYVEKDLKMHFNVITSLALLTGLVAASPTPDQSPNLQARETRPDYRVRYYKDEYCEHTTGSASDNQPSGCENLDFLSVDVKSIEAMVDGGITNSHCTWTLFVWTDYDCKGSGYRLMPSQCFKISNTNDNKPIKSYRMGPSADPCP